MECLNEKYSFDPSMRYSAVLQFSNKSGFIDTEFPAGNFQIIDDCIGFVENYLVFQYDDSVTVMIFDNRDCCIIDKYPCGDYNLH